jgi:hypothetical protein
MINRNILLAVGLALTVLTLINVIPHMIRDCMASEEFSATLVGHAWLPAMTFVTPPEGAPGLLQISGRFTGTGFARTDQLYSIEGKSWIAPKETPRATGLFLPFVGQPVQGFSGIKHMGDGVFMVLVDNGFGNQKNSPDAMLMVHWIRPTWKSRRVEMVKTIFLHDSDRVLPFRLVNEHTEMRYLMGSDFDPEGMQPVGDRIWFSDEFGPYIFATDLNGKVVAFYETEVDSKIVRSPDNHSLQMPSVPGDVMFEVRRSRGFEGMAASPDGKFLYLLFEGPLWDARKNQWESADGKQFLRIIEFDVQAGRFTGRQWKYLLEVNGNNIGDFNMISPTKGLVIERDGGEGDPRLGCKGEPRSDCFNKPAMFKRIYLIDFAALEDGFVRKVGYVNLMNISDPNGIAGRGATDGVFTFPFVTIENVDMVDKNHVVVGNDNNLPFSTGRTIGKADDNELILLDVGDMLTR